MKLGRLILLCAFLAVVGAWCVFFRPVFAGGPAGYIIVSGHSMNPKYWTGDLVITHRQPAYHIGDIVAFTIPAGEQGAGNNVIHRLVGGDGTDGFVPQGINNPAPDQWRPRTSDIIGKAWIHVGGAGNKVVSLRQPRNFAMLIAGMTSFSLLGNKKLKLHKARGRHMTNHNPSHGKSAGNGEAPFNLPGPLWALGALGVALVLLAGFGFLAIKTLGKPETKARFVEQLHYDQTGSYDYTLNVQPSTLYPTGVIGPVTAPPPVNGNVKTAAADPPPVFTKLAKSIDLGFNYGLKSAKPAVVQGVISADMQVRATGDITWTKTQPLLGPTPFSGPDARIRVSIDFAPIASLIDTIEKETGFTAQGYEVAIVPSVHVTGTVDGQPIDELYGQPFTIKYNKTNLTPDTALASSTPKSIGASVLEPQHVHIAGIALGVASARALGFVGGSLAALAAAGFGGMIFLGIGQGEKAQIRARYGTKLLPVTEADTDGAHKVQVARLEDLAILASRDGKIIFSQELPDGDRFFVPDGPITYEYAPKNTES